MFRLEGHLTDAEYLPPYVEVAKLSRESFYSPVARSCDASLEILSARISQGGPACNPFHRYATRFSANLEWVRGESLLRAFTTTPLPRCDSAAPRSSWPARTSVWLEAGGECASRSPTAEACARIAATAKALQFKAARAVTVRRPFDASTSFETMAGAWDDTMAALVHRYGS